MISRVASLTEQDIEKIVEDKDSHNTKRSTKVAKELFADCYSNYVPLICIFYTFRNKLPIFFGSIYNKTVIITIY